MKYYFDILDKVRISTEILTITNLSSLSMRINDMLLPYCMFSVCSMCVWGA